tara:strand:+ start:1732 stop:2439 length:708 start_codon:yes stop_codon:yes gene_type:complete
VLGSYFLFSEYKLIEGLLYLIGSFIGYRVMRISREGYRNTRSPTLLRLTISFIALTIGFFLTAFTYIFPVFYNLTFQSDLILNFRFEFFNISIALTSLFFIIAASFELLGYFILALGHGIKSYQKASAVSVAYGFLTTVSVLSILKSISFVFLLYGSFETLLSYLESKKRPILYMFLGFTALSAGEFIRWLALFYSGLSPLMISSILVKLIGFIMLYTPVSSFNTYKGEENNVRL